MICDHTGCKNEPMRAPRLIVPAVTWEEPGHRAIRVMTTLHYCELHKGELKVEDVLNSRLKRRCEKVAREQRPHGYKCDFSAAFIEYVLITTPEYRAFMQGVDISKLVIAA